VDYSFHQAAKLLPTHLIVFFAICNQFFVVFDPLLLAFLLSFFSRDGVFNF